jgi:hypothetical protein
VKNYPIEMLPDWLLDLADDQEVECDAIHGAHLKADAGDVAHAAAAGAVDTLDGDLVVFIDEVKGAVAGHESRGESAILNDLDTNTFADGGVRLLGLNSHFLEYDASTHGSALEKILLRSSALPAEDVVLALVPHSPPVIFEPAGTEHTVSQTILHLPV